MLLGQDVSSLQLSKTRISKRVLELGFCICRTSQNTWELSLCQHLGEKGEEVGIEVNK